MVTTPGGGGGSKSDLTRTPAGKPIPQIGGVSVVNAKGQRGTVPAGENAYRPPLDATPHTPDPQVTRHSEGGTAHLTNATGGVISKASIQAAANKAALASVGAVASAPNVTRPGGPGIRKATPVGSPASAPNVTRPGGPGIRKATPVGSPAAVKAAANTAAAVAGGYVRPGSKSVPAATAARMAATQKAVKGGK